MDGTIAQSVALTCHGNAFLRKLPRAEFFPDNPPPRQFGGRHIVGIQRLLRVMSSAAKTKCMDVRRQVYRITRSLWLGPFASPARCGSLVAADVTHILNVGEAPSVLTAKDGPFREVAWRPIADLETMPVESALECCIASHGLRARRASLRALRGRTEPLADGSLALSDSLRLACRRGESHDRDSGIGCCTGALATNQSSLDRERAAIRQAIAASASPPRGPGAGICLTMHRTCWSEDCSNYH